VILALWIGGEDLKLKGHHPTPFWEAKKHPLHPHTEQYESKTVNKMKKIVL
jgi:hypothetical protein